MPGATWCHTPWPGPLSPLSPLGTTDCQKLPSSVHFGAARLARFHKIASNEFMLDLYYSIHIFTILGYINIQYVYIYIYNYIYIVLVYIYIIIIYIYIRIYSHT